jgi:hypothetical protein
LWDLSRKGSGFSGENDLEACLQGVFNDKGRRRKALKLTKGFFMFFSFYIRQCKIFEQFLIIFDHPKICSICGQKTSNYR